MVIIMSEVNFIIYSIPGGFLNSIKKAQFLRSKGFKLIIRDGEICFKNVNEYMKAYLALSKSGNLTEDEQKQWKDLLVRNLTLKKRSEEKKRKDILVNSEKHLLTFNIVGNFLDTYKIAMFLRKNGFDVNVSNGNVGLTDINSYMMAYKLLKKNNISLPDNRWTWKDFYNICKKITKDTNNDGKTDQFGVYDYSWIDAIYSNGGGIFNGSGTSCNITNPSVEDAILFARNIYQLSGRQSPTSEDFDKGNIAFRPVTFSEFRTYKPYPWRINKYFDFEWDCIPLPEGPDGKNLSETETMLMGINAKSEHGGLAWNFLKKLTYDEEVQQKIFQYSKGISPLKKVTNSEKTEEILKNSIGDDTTVQVSMLNQIMESAARKEKFQQYDTVIDYMDGEILRLFQEEGDFDMNLLHLKKKIDRMLKEN